MKANASKFLCWNCRWEGKRVILKKVATRTQSKRNFPKNNYFLPSDTHTCDFISRRREMFVFRKIWRALFPFYLLSEIRLFNLLPTNYYLITTLLLPLRKKCRYSELFWFAFFSHFPAFGLNANWSQTDCIRIQSKYGKIQVKCGPE